MVEKVEKPWGYELIFAHTDKYVGKILHINKNARLSSQYHKQKDETLFVLNGVVEVHLELNDIRKLVPGDSVQILPKVVHRIKGIMDSDIVEVSTPEITDVIRLEDDYGRV